MLGMWCNFCKRAVGWDGEYPKVCVLCGKSGDPLKQAACGMKGCGLSSDDESQEEPSE